MIKHHAWVVLAIILGCSQPKRPVVDRADTDENQAILAKIQGYISCLDDHAPRIFQISDLYTERLGGKPPDRETNLVLPVSNDPKTCVEAIDAAKALQPRLPELEAAADAYSKAVKAVFALTTDGHAAYDRSKSYDPAKAIALHPKLVAAFAEFDAAQGAFFDQVYRQNRTVHKDQLARREKRDGRTLMILADIMMFHAEDLVRFGAIPWNHLDKLDVAAIAAPLAAFESALEEISTYAIGHPTEVDNDMKEWPRLRDRARLYLIAGKQLVNRARDNIAYSDADKLMIASNNEAAVAGTPTSVVKAYNDLLEAYPWSR